MKVEFSNLDKIINDPATKEKSACNSSDCLNEFLNLTTNFITDCKKLTESELAMFIKSMQQWLIRKDYDTCRSEVNIGDIFNVDLGINYKPELSYNHPALVIEVIGSFAIIIPVSTSSKKINGAFHPLDNPTGNWYYRKATRIDGFRETCVLMLSNMRFMSMGRLLEKRVL